MMGFLSCTLTGNSTIQRDFQTWTNITITGNINKKTPVLKRVKYWLENQERFGDDSTRITQSLLRQALGYEIKSNISLWVGYAWIHTGFPNTTKPFTEDRVWEQLLWSTKIKEIKVTNRTRMEQRFLENNGKVAYRARQLVKLAIPVTCFPKFSLIGSDEIFWHKNDFIGKNGKGFDQNRFFAGIGYELNKKATVETGYMNQYIRRFGVPNFLANILQVNLVVNL
ncbi:MAG: DUF2490 domain-containing protein [Legionella sp.]|nr:DUF2490 domain-containing protein [Legionella sp.]